MELGRFGESYEDHMSAASFAEAGDFDSAREMLSRRKRILLVLTGRELDEKSFQYAVNMAQRTDADIEALVTVRGKGVDEMLDSFAERSAADNTSFKVVRKKKGCIKDAVIKHTRRRRDFLCVVIESADSLDMECPDNNRKLEGVWGKLGCPLAVVS